MQTGFALIPQCPRCQSDWTGDAMLCDECRAEGAHTTYTKRTCAVCDRPFLIHYLEEDQFRLICDRVDCRTATAHLREAA